MDQPLKNIFTTAINAIEAAAAIAASNAERATSDAERHAAFAKDAVEKIKAASKATEELPSAVLETSSSCDDTCDICDYLPPWREVDKERGICSICAEHLHDGPKYYTEEFAHASAQGTDALRLLIVRQRADNCRDTIAAAAGSYDGDLELHEASVEETFLNKRAAECLARLPACFAPWWKDTWSHEKWCEMASAREAAGWPVKKSALIAERLAAMFLNQQHKARELKKTTQELEAKHTEVLANIERARKEDLAAVEARYKREMREAVAEAVEAARLAEAETAGTMNAYEAMRSELEGMRQKVADAMALATQWKGKCGDVTAMEARYKREMAEKDKRYREALDPLLGVRDKVRAECEKKCEDANRKSYAMGYAFADQKWNPVYKAVCEELDAARKKLDAEMAAATEVYRAMRADLERLSAENKALREKAEEDKQMVQRHLKEVAKGHVGMTAWEKEKIERLREENKTLQKKQEALLELVDPTIKLMKSNPELFGGEGRGGAAAPAEARGSSSPSPPPIIRIKEEVKEEDKGRALNFLRSLLAPSRPCLLVESSSTVLPGIVEAEAFSSQTEGLCMALTEEQYKEMFGADLPPPSPPVVPDQDKLCGTAGCIECPPAVAEPVAEPVAAQKPKPNYNHPNWPSPMTKRFAKHLAKRSGKTDPKTIKTHQGALEFIAKRANVSVETLLKWTINHYWTLVQGSSHHFHMSTGSATWWC